MGTKDVTPGKTARRYTDLSVRQGTLTCLETVSKSAITSKEKVFKTVIFQLHLAMVFPLRGYGYEK